MLCAVETRLFDCARMLFMPFPAKNYTILICNQHILIATIPYAIGHIGNSVKWLDSSALS